MVKTKIKINRQRLVVWNFFINTKNWKKWWGGGLKKVKPGWKSGAKLIWKTDPISKVISVVPQRELQVESPGLYDIFHFKYLGKGSTLVDIESTPIGGASFSNGGLAYIKQLNTSY